MLMCNLLGRDLEGNYNLKGVGSEVTDVSLSIVGRDIVTNGEGRRIDLTALLGNESSTEDNPIIGIIADGVSIVEGVDTRLRYIPFDNGLLVMLIRGHILVRTAEGDDIPITRGVGEVSSLLGTDYSKASTFKNLNLIQDIESGIYFNDFVVSDCTMKIKLNTDLKSVSFNPQNFVFLDEEGFNLQKEKALELKRVEEEKVKLRDQRNKFTYSLVSEDVKQPEKKKSQSITKGVENLSATAFTRMVRALV